MYLHAVNVLEHNGFFQYEISNFARPGFHSRHNCKYWLGAEYLGLGPAAHSLMAGRRFFSRDLGRFLSAKDPLSLLQDDGPGGGLAEYAMLGLRLTQGICREEAAARCPDYDWDGLWQRARIMIRAGYMRLEKGRLFFTPEGFCSPTPFWRGFYKRRCGNPLFLRHRRRKQLLSFPSVIIIKGTA